MFNYLAMFINIIETFCNFLFIPYNLYYNLYYNTDFSYVRNIIHCGMAQAKLTWITLRLRREKCT